jgi:hypothetical protein
MERELFSGVICVAAAWDTQGFGFYRLDPHQLQATD